MRQYVSIAGLELKLGTLELKASTVRTYTYRHYVIRGLDPIGTRLKKRHSTVSHYELNGTKYLSLASAVAAIKAAEAKAFHKRNSSISATAIARSVPGVGARHSINHATLRTGKVR